MRSNKQKTIFAFVIMVFLAVLFGLIILRQNLSTNRANADNSSGKYVYKQQIQGDQVQHFGNLYGFNQYRADTSDDPYNLSGMKLIKNIKFSGTNLPQKASVKFCVEAFSPEKKVSRELICDIEVLYEGYNYSWEKNFENKGLLVRDNLDYYCSLEVFDFSQTQDIATDIPVSCELTIEPIESNDIALITLYPSLLNKLAQEEMVPDVLYAAQKDIVINEMIAKGVVQNPEGLHKINDMYLKINNSNNENILISSDSVQNGLVDGEKLIIKKGSSFSFFTDKSTSFTGIFTGVVLIEVDDLNSEIDRRDIFTLNSEQRVKYCEDYYYNYRNSLTVLGLDESKKQERCKAVLSGNVW